MMVALLHSLAKLPTPVYPRILVKNHKTLNAIPRKLISVGETGTSGSDATRTR